MVVMTVEQDGIEPLVNICSESYEHNFEYDLTAQAWGSQWRYQNNDLETIGW